jgi:RHS repeat-associated protein
VFDGGLSVQEYDVSSSSVLQTSNLKTEYVRGPDLGGGVGGMVYSIADGTRTYSHANHRGDVIGRSDSSGSLTSFALYEAYGKRPYEWGDDPDRQKANTKEEESDLGLLNEGMRFRDLETGVFLTRDPIGYADGPNVYCYVHCNPITGFDPLGLKWTSAEVDGNAYAYDARWHGGAEDAVLLGTVDTTTQNALDGNGNSVQNTRSTVTFSHNGNSHTMEMSAVHTAMQNVPKELSKQLKGASYDDRLGMIKDFLTTPVEASGSTRAKVAGVIDAGISRVAGITAFGDQRMNNHGQGGLAQMLMGVDSRDPSYTDETMNNGAWIDGGGAGMTMAMVYTQTGQRSGPTAKKAAKAQFRAETQGQDLKVIRKGQDQTGPIIGVGVKGGGSTYRPKVSEGSYSVGYKGRVDHYRPTPEGGYRVNGDG